MTGRVIEAKAVISASDQTGKTFDNIAKKIEGISKSAKAFEGIKPFEKMGWGQNFTKELDGLKLSARDLDAVSKSWSNFHKTLNATPMTMSQTVNAMGAWKRQTLASLREVKAATEDTERSHVRYLKNAAKYAVGAIGIGIGAHEIGRAGRAIGRNAAARNREQVQQELAGFTNNERTAATARADELAAKYPGLSRTEILKDIRENKARLGGFDRSLAASDTYARAKLSTIMSGGDEHSLGRVVRALEGAGMANSPDQLEAGLNAWSRAHAVNADYSEQDFANDMRTAALAKYGMSKEYRENVFPVLASHVPGFGNKLATATSAFVGGRMTKQAKAALGQYGLLDKNGKVIDQDLWLKNNFEWTQKYIRPKLEAQGVKFGEHMSDEDKLKVAKVSAQIASAKNTGDLIASNLLDEPLVRRYAGKGAMDLGGIAALQFKDAGIAMAGVTKQTGDFTTALLNLEPALRMMNAYSQTLANVTNSFNQGSTADKTGKVILGGAGVAGAAIAVGKTWQWLTGAAALGQSAIALDGAAAALSAAAIRLGAGGTLGTAAPAVAAATAGILSGAGGVIAGVGGPLTAASAWAAYKAWQINKAHPEWGPADIVGGDADMVYAQRYGVDHPAGPRAWPSVNNDGKGHIGLPEFALPGVAGGAPPIAELKGSAEVHGEVQGKFIVEAGSELLRIVESIRDLPIRLAGMLAANGPGSNGRTSPDAQPGAGGIGHM